MRTVLFILLLAAAGAALAAASAVNPFHAHLNLRGIVGLVSVGALGAMLTWHLRR